jgi:hypothetical protein
VAWLVLPQFRGASFIYDKFVREQLRKNGVRLHDHHGHAADHVPHVFQVCVSARAAPLFAVCIDRSRERRLISLSLSHGACLPNAQAEHHAVH